MVTAPDAYSDLNKLLRMERNYQAALPVDRAVRDLLRQTILCLVNEELYNHNEKQIGWDEVHEIYGWHTVSGVTGRVECECMDHFAAEVTK